MNKFFAWIKRRLLIKSAQQKVRDDENASRVTCDEWNALAYKPLQEIWRDINKRSK